MRIIKKMKVIIFIAGILCINQLLCFLLCPIGGASEVMWKDFQSTEEINTVYVGSSVCLRAFNPYVIDDILGTKSFNMGTPSQPLQQSYLSLKTAIEERDIKRAVLGMGYFSLNQEKDSNAIIANWQASTKNVSLWKKITSGLSIMFSKSYRDTDDSINFLFPWIYNRVPLHREDILENVKSKLAGDTAEDNKMVNDEERQYVGRGYGYYKGTVDVDKVGKQNSKAAYGYDEKPEAYGYLKKMIQLCKNNNVELLVINVPHPTFDIISYGDEYFTKYEKLKTFFSDNGVDYYDFNLSRPQLFQSKDEYYNDYEHLNKNGSEVFSKAFADFLQLYEEGNDMEQYFYTKEEYLASVNYITNAWMDVIRDGDQLTLQAGAYYGSDVQAEYQFEIWNDDTENYEVLRDYDTTASYQVEQTFESGAAIKFRVNVRQTGAAVAYEHYYEVQCTY